MDYKQHIKNLLLKNKEGIYKTNKNKSVVVLVDILEEEITNFTYEGSKNIYFLFDLLDCLGKMLENEESLQSQFHDRFTYIHNMIRTLIHAKPEEPDFHIDNRYNLLKALINRMENTMLRIYYNNPTDYNPDKEEFIYYIVFKLKYINFFKAAITKFPYIVNSADEAGVSLVEKVCDKYLEALDTYLCDANLGPIDDLIYYDKVMQAIMTSEKLNVDDYTKKLMLKKVKTFAKKHEFDNNRLKEKLSFFINNIVNIINGEPEDLSVEFLNYKYEVHDKFKQAHVLESKTIYNAHKVIKGRPAKRKIYTFDGEGAKELDDGLSITYENGIYHVGVHIADPGFYIPQTSILMDEAKKRTTSLYMEDTCIPLFPFNLSSDIMSLNTGKKTMAMSYYFDIDALTGELINFDIKNELVAITANMSYDYFNQCIDQGTENKELFETLIHLCNVAEIFKKTYKEDSIYHELHKDKDTTLSRSVVESAMIYTNYQVAKLFSERELPFIYRCHNIDSLSIEQLTQLQERLRDTHHTERIIKDIEMMKNIFPRAYYTRKNSGHFGLGIQYYCHATSPLRRLADNLVNECIKKFILNPYTEDDVKRMEDKIDEIAENINNKRATSDDYEIQYIHRKYLGKKNT